jgi:hypothetical protein
MNYRAIFQIFKICREYFARISNQCLIASFSITTSTGTKAATAVTAVTSSSGKASGILSNARPVNDQAVAAMSALMAHRGPDGAGQWRETDGRVVLGHRRLAIICTGEDGRGGVTAHPCGVCQACTEIDADRFIDYIELDAASNRSIDEIRDLIERAAYKPSVGRFKVFMIDEAHQLTKDAFNALLKTLEEPPDYLKFVLATTDPEKMLPTVLSRCLQFNLRPMAPEVVQSHLQQVLQAEGVAADAGSLRLLSRAARG